MTQSRSKILWLLDQFEKEIDTSLLSSSLWTSM